jgi:hypothetical protein
MIFEELFAQQLTISEANYLSEMEKGEKSQDFT